MKRWHHVVIWICIAALYIAALVLWIQYESYVSEINQRKYWEAVTKSTAEAQKVADHEKAERKWREEQIKRAME